MASGQCVRILSHRGPLTNAFYAPRYKHLETDKFHPSVVINTFEKKRGGDGVSSIESEMSAQLHMRYPPLMKVAEETGKDQKVEQTGELTRQVTENELDHLKRINHQLYTFAIDKVLSNGAKKRK